MNEFDWDSDRVASGEAMARVSAVLGDYADSGAQDWDLEAARPERFEAYVEAYATRDWTEDERFALAGLLFAALDDRLYGDQPIAAEVLARFEALMVRDAANVAPRVGYWSLIEEEDPDNVFRATPVARAIRARAEALGRRAASGLDLP